MRWPFMLRATHDALMAAKAEALAFTDGQRLYAESRYDDLLTQHRQFLATLAERTLPPAKPAPPAPVVKVRDAADVAADTAAMFDPRRRRSLNQFLRQRRAEGVAAEDIAQEILHPPATGYGEWEMPE